MRSAEVETFTAIEPFTGTKHRRCGARRPPSLDPEAKPAAIFHVTR